MLTSSDIKIRTFTGSGLKTYIPSIARLRLEVFRGYPDLHEGNMELEIQYLKNYLQCKDSIAVIVFDGSMIVGSATGIPLECEDARIQQPFLKGRLPSESFFYFDESVLLKEYRGRGIGHHFFDLRETHAKNLKRFQQTCFCSLIRPEDHPSKPVNFIPLDNFWRKRGYTPHPEMQCKLAWKDIGQEEETEKLLTFWLKKL
jgi:GNAT superfamily N-acetyltransferase